MSANVKWIKIVTDIFDDEKILLIESIPEADAIIVIWFKLLTLAGKINNGGVLMFNEKLPYTDEMLATIFRRPINTVRLAIKTFEQFEMVEIINNTITIPNWSKHQTLDQLEERKEYMKNYMRDYRKKQRQLAEGEFCKVNSKANVNSLEEDIDIDKDNIYSASDDTQNNSSTQKNSGTKQYSVFERLWSMYPEKKGKGQVSKKSKEQIEKLGIEKMEKALQRYIDDVEKQRKQGFSSLRYKNGSTWFNSGYEDYLVEENSVTENKKDPAKIVYVNRGYLE